MSLLILTLVLTVLLTAPSKVFAQSQQDDPAVILQQQLNAFLDQLNAFGRQTFVGYTPVSRISFYSAFGTAVASPFSTLDLNAFYNFKDHAIYLSVELLQAMSMRFGPYVFESIVFHEWGHHILDFRKITQREDYGDCIAGAHFHGSSISFVDINQIAMSFAAVGSKPGQEANDPHGTPAQRIEFFISGFRDGLRSCEAMLQHPARK